MKQLTKGKRAAAKGRTKAARRVRPQRPVPADDAGTEQRILEAAHTVFLQRGTSGARMQDVAREAGVNQALLHYYFRSKERLSEAVFQRAARQLMPKIFEVMASDLDLEDKVARIVEVEIDQLSQTPYLPGYIISEVTHHPERAKQLFTMLSGVNPDEVAPRVHGIVQKQITARVREGRMRPIELEQFLVNLIGLCLFPFAARPMLMAILGMNDPGFERFIAHRREELADFFLRALRP